MFKFSLRTKDFSACPPCSCTRLERKGHCGRECTGKMNWNLVHARLVAYIWCFCLQWRAVWKTFVKHIFPPEKKCGVVSAFDVVYVSLVEETKTSAKSMTDDDYFLTELQFVATAAICHECITFSSKISLFFAALPHTTLKQKTARIRGQQTTKMHIQSKERELHCLVVSFLFPSFCFSPHTSVSNPFFLLIFTRNCNFFCFFFWIFF